MPDDKVKTVALDEETYNLIKGPCCEELLRHHPELIKMNITLNKIIWHACKYYIEN